MITNTPAVGQLKPVDSITKHPDYNFWLPGVQAVTSGPVVDKLATYDAAIQAGTIDAEVWANAGYFTAKDAVNGHVAQPVGAGAVEFGLGTESMILGFWINKAAPVGQGSFIGQTNTGTGIGWRIVLRTDGKFNFTIDATTTAYSGAIGGAEGVIMDSTDHHFVVCLDGPTKTAYFFLDGAVPTAQPTKDFSAVTTTCKDVTHGLGWGAAAQGTDSEAMKIKDAHCLIMTGGLPGNYAAIAKRLYSVPFYPIPSDMY